MKSTHSINNNPAVKIGLFVRLESKPGKEADVENFLRLAVSHLSKKNPLLLCGLLFVLGCLFLLFLMLSLMRKDETLTLLESRKGSVCKKRRTFLHKLLLLKNLKR